MLFSSSVVLLATVASSLANPLPKRAATSKYAVSEKTSFLAASSGNTGLTSSAALRNARYPNLQFGEEPLTASLGGVEFLLNVTIGGQVFALIFDTGSSDTWTVESGFTCVNYTTNATVPESACDFGPIYTPSSTFEEIPDVNFNISYGSGEYLNGILAKETIEVAGITVTSQEFALATLAGWAGSGDGFSSGLTGWAYSSITDQYPGTNAAADEPNAANPNITNDIPYSDLPNTIFFVENLTQPLFSLALARDASGALMANGGTLAIGGIPDVTDPTINASSTFAVAPIEIAQYKPIPDTTGFTFYATTIDGLVYNGSPMTQTQFIVDSGTTLLYCPPADAIAINALFDPPAEYSPDDGIFLINCTATAPSLGVQISGEVFEINPTDLISTAGAEDNICVSGIQPGGDGLPNLLGDVFLNNVLAVFDVGQSELAFSAREYYATS